MDKLSVLERLYAALVLWLRENRIVLLSGMGAGLLAHGFAFGNKLLNADEIQSLFGKGATVTSGRWGLELCRYLFPDLSVPWLYGLLSLALLSLAACLAVRLLQIQSPCLQGLLGALFTTFPGETGLFCFMFTSAPYALGFALTAGAVLLADRGGRRDWLSGLALLVLANGIYQAYTGVAASFFVLRMIQDLLRQRRRAREVLVYGLRSLGLLALALALYYAVSRAAATATGLGFAAYGVEQATSLPRRIMLAYSAFLRTFTRGYFGYVNSGLSLTMHALMLLVTAVCLVLWLLRCRDRWAAALLLLCLVLFPLSAYGIYMIAELGVIHSLVLCSFLSVYLLSALVLESVPSPLRRDGLILAMTLIAAGNIFFANKVYLKMHVQYEQTYAFYTGLVSRIQSSPGYDGESRVALVGDAEAERYTVEELEIPMLMGPTSDLVNAYTRERFIQVYLGFDLDFLSKSECRALARDPRVQAMPLYPYDGSIQELDGVIVVHLGQYK